MIGDVQKLVLLSNRASVACFVSIFVMCHVFLLQRRLSFLRTVCVFSSLHVGINFTVHPSLSLLLSVVSTARCCFQQSKRFPYVFSVAVLVGVGCAASFDSPPLSDISRQNSEEEPERSVELSLQEEIQRVTNVKASSKIK